MKGTCNKRALQFGTMKGKTNLTHQLKVGLWPVSSSFNWKVIWSRQYIVAVAEKMSITRTSIVSLLIKLIGLGESQLYPERSTAGNNDPNIV